MIVNIDEVILQSAWEFSRQFPSPGGKWRAYLNELAIQTFLAWLAEDEEFSEVVAQKSDPEIWEQVNGGAIALGEQTLVIIPSEDYDTSELRVSQEWIDIPSWAGDYYIGAQIDTVDNEIRFWGYESHKVIKEKGEFDYGDRCYSLDADELIRNIEVLWIKQCLNPTQQTKTPVEPIPELNPQQLDNLASRLGKPDLLFPRREVPFESWAALLENEPYRKKWFYNRLK